MTMNINETRRRARTAVRRLDKGDDGADLLQSFEGYAKAIGGLNGKRRAVELARMDGLFARVVEVLERRRANGAARLVEILIAWEQSFWFRNRDELTTRPEELLDKAMACAERYLGTESLETGLALRAKVYSFELRRDREAQRSAYLRALRIIASAVGKNHPEYLASMWHAEEFLPPREVVELVEERTRTFERLYGQRDQRVAHSVRELATALLAVGECERAVAEIERVIEIVTGPDGDDWLAVELLRSLGVALARAGRFAEGAEALERSCLLHVTSKHRLLGDQSHHRLMGAIEELAAVRGRIGGFDAVTEAYRWGERQVARRLVDGGTFRVTCRWRRGYAAYAAGRFKEAARLLRSFAKHWGEPWKAVVSGCSSVPTVVKCLIGQGKYTEALRALRRAIALGDEEVQYSAKRELYDVLMLAGREREAATARTEFEKLRDQWLQAPSISAQGLTDVRPVPGERSALEDKESRLTAALEDAERRYGPKGDKMQPALVELGRYWLKKGRLDQAEVLLKRACEIAGRFHESVGTGCEGHVALAELQELQGRAEDAAATLSTIVEMERLFPRSLSTGSQALLKAMMNVARLYLSFGAPAKAEVVLSELELQQRLRFGGIDWPFYRTVVDELEAVRLLRDCASPARSSV